MWKSITCYLSGNHEFAIACEPGEIFLRCAHCGKRSSGWVLSGSPKLQPARVSAPTRAQAPRPPQQRALTRAA